MKQTRRPIVQVMICIGALIVIWGAYFMTVRKIDQRIEKICEDDLLWVAQVEELQHKEGKFILEGFSFRINRDADDEAFEIVLMDMETGKYLFPKMEYVERKDVNDYFLCEYDYTKSGFIATLNDRLLDFDEKQYEVLIRPKGTKEVRRFGNYLIDEKVTYVHPEKFVPLEATATDLEEIIADGVCIMSRPDVGLCIYQQEKKLYWIAEQGYGFYDNNQTSVECMIATTQGSKLFGEKKRDTKVNNGFIFEEKEVEDMSTDDYRVAVTDIPSEYPVEHFVVGDHTEVDGWIWNEPIRPWYGIE